VPEVVFDRRTIVQFAPAMIREVVPRDERPAAQPQPPGPFFLEFAMPFG
jgi:hypothetical protein